MSREANTAQRIRVTVLLICIVVAGAFLPYPELLDHRSEKGRQILMIGNSFTFGAGMPGLLRELLSRSDHDFSIRVVAPGGKYLDWHSENPSTLSALRAQEWDLVILQDCSTCPLHYKKYFNRGVRRMVELVREIGAKPLLYMTWSDKGELADQKVITSEYQRIGSELDVQVVPVGSAWQRAQEGSLEVNLFAADDHHAGGLGALLTAYVFGHFLQSQQAIPVITSVPEYKRFLYQFFFPPHFEFVDDQISSYLHGIAADTVREERKG